MARCEGRVLVVEDDESWQDIYKEMLTDKGYTVKTVGNWEDARDALNHRFFHVAIVDLRLSEEDAQNRDGLLVLDRIWRLDEGTAAIVASGYLDMTLYDEFRKYGVLGLAEKPASRPDEAIAELESLTFIKGEVNKNMLPVEIIQAVERVISETQRRNIREIWATSPFSFIAEPSAREIQRKLGNGQMVELRPFLGDLCRPFMPWLQAKERPIEIRIQERSVGFQAPCWSRALGKAIVIRFGRRDIFEKDENALVLESLDEVDKVWRIRNELKHIASAHFEGFVYSVEDVDFERYFRLPTLKKNHLDKQAVGGKDGKRNTQ